MHKGQGYLSLVGLPQQNAKDWWLKQQTFVFLQFSRLEIPDQGPTESVSGEDSLLDLQTSCCVLIRPSFHVFV